MRTNFSSRPEQAVSSSAQRRDLRSDLALEAEILRLLQLRGPDKTICPSEAARSVAAQTTDTPVQALTQADWQPLMEPARAAACRLSAQGLLDITQHGHTVDPATAKGPIRLRLR